MKVKGSTVIILVNFNSYEDTKDCILSISNSEGIMPYVVLVDNNSTEKKELNNLLDIYPKLKIIKNKFNLGFGRANNIGIKWAQNNVNFNYLLLLNNDTIIEANTINYLKSPFLKDLTIGITSGKTMYEANRDIVWYGGGDINYRRGWPKIADYNIEASNQGANCSRYVTFVSGCVMMFSKKAIESIKGFDDDYFMYCEDLELCIRANKLNWKLYYESKSNIYHKVQGSSRAKGDKPLDLHPSNSNSMFLYYHMRTNQYFTFRKYLNKFELIIFSINYFMMLLVSNLRMIKGGRFDVVSVTVNIIKNIIKNKTA